MAATVPTPTRRLLPDGAYPTRMAARYAAVYWRNRTPRGARVRVERGAPGTTTDMPWGVTAETGGGGSS